MPVLQIDDFDLVRFTDVAAAYGTGRFGYVVTPNVDHVIRYYDDAAFRELYADSAYVLLDSRLLSYLLRLTRGMRARVCTGSDLTARLFSHVISPDDRIVIIGATADQAQTLRDRYGLKNLHHHNPPMGFVNDSRAVEECLKFVEAHSPFRFLMLAVGSPQQEILGRQLKSRGIARGLALCIGASINFITGVERRAPRWMQDIAMEWLYRLMQDPRRLAKRYLLRGPRVFALLLMGRIDLRSRPPAPAADQGQLLPVATQTRCALK